MRTPCYEDVRSMLDLFECYEGGAYSRRLKMGSLLRKTSLK